MRLGITGSSGFIGWHLRCHLLQRPEIECVFANEDEFSSGDALKDFVSQCDAIIHLAGMNRGKEQKVYETNVTLAEKLVKACEEKRVGPHIIFTNSIQYKLNNAYGRSKREAWSIIKKWSQKIGAKCTNVILPNVFGEHCRPFYNSVVATFCYQLANGYEPKIIEDRVIPLIHVGKVAEIFIKILQEGLEGDVRPEGKEIKVSKLLDLLSNLDSTYKQGIIPEVSDSFIRQLFNTYRSYLFPSFYPVRPRVNIDERGELFETVVSKSGGQCFVSTTKPGITRGNHYHVNKFERFFIVKGEALLRLRRLLSDDIEEFYIDGRDPGYVDIPTLHTHNITNIGEGELITLFWADEIYDPENPDTYAEFV